MAFTDRADNLLALLRSRGEFASGEISFVAYSYGGLVSKQILRSAEAKASNDPVIAGILHNTRRVCFLGTPHLGADLASIGNVLRLIARPSASAVDLVRNAPYLRNLNLWYRSYSANHRIASLNLVEAQRTWLGHIVKPDSADPGLSSDPILVDANHTTIASPKDRNDEIYIHVRDFLAQPSIGVHRDTAITTGLLKNSDSLETLHHKMDELRETLVTKATPSATALDTMSIDPLIADAIARDLERQYDCVLRRSQFPEGARSDEFQALAQAVLDGKYAATPSNLRRRVLLRASRSASVRKQIERAESLLTAAQSLTSDENDAPARARLEEARGRADEAMRLVRDETDIEGRSTFVSILVRQKGVESAVSWMKENNVPPSTLNATGLHPIAMAYLSEESIEPLRRLLIGLPDNILIANPNFLLLRALALLASVLPAPDQFLVFQPNPLDVRSIHPILPEQDVVDRLTLASSDLLRLAPTLQELGLSEAKQSADLLQVWCDLLNPYRRAPALIRLRNEMLDPETALHRVQFAFAFDPNFDPKPIEQFIERRQDLGGLNKTELGAALVLRLHGKSPKGISDLIVKNRTQFNTWFDPAAIASIEIQALAKAGESTSAQALLNASRDQFGPQHLATLEAEIERGEGGDAVAVYLKAYEATGTAESLRSLLTALIQAGDDRQVAVYAEQLFEKTEDPGDIAVAAQAYAKAGDEKSFSRVFQSHPVLRDRYPALTSHYAWLLFHLGRLREAKELVGELARKRPPHRDLRLEIALSIASGDWENLSPVLTAFLDNPTTHNPRLLMQAAHLSQASGEGPMLELMKAALERAGNDPNVWLGAYTLAMEEDLEKLPGVHDWFRKAMDLSGDDGPIKRFELKELLPQQLEWNERTRKISEHVVNGEVPLVIAAPALRTTVVDIVLRNIIRNSALEDARRRIAIPLFSGARRPEPCGNLSCVALDITALMLLGWLGLLPKVIEAFPSIIVAAGTLQEIFEGQRKIRQFQRSRLRRAEEIHRAIARGQVHVLRASKTGHDELSSEVGPDFAALLRATRQADGIVLRPAPLHRPGLDQLPANIESQADLITDMHTLLKVLAKDFGLVNENLEATASEYFSIQDKGWPSAAKPTPQKPLFIDSLALTYLQHTNLLPVVLSAFTDVTIEGDAEEEALILIDNNIHVTEVLATLKAVRVTIRDAYEAGKISFGPQTVGSGSESSDDSDNDDGRSSTIHLLSDLGNADGVVFDDRVLNREPFAQDRQNHRARTLSTLDIIEELRARNLISEMDRRHLRHRLRVAGTLLIPVDDDEIVAAAQRSGALESAEFRAIRESIDLARVAEVPKFPNEIRWLLSLTTSPRRALMQIWNTETDHERAAELSALILDLQPNLGEWLSSWRGNPPPNWSNAVNRVSVASLAMPVEITDDQTRAAYSNWLETTVLSELRTNDREFYGEVISYVRGFISDLHKDDHDDE
jgi:tetratricopeptide (TPR) repeat protein